MFFKLLLLVGAPIAILNHWLENYYIPRKILKRRGIDENELRVQEMILVLSAKELEELRSPYSSQERIGELLCTAFNRRLAMKPEALGNN